MSSEVLDEIRGLIDDGDGAHFVGGCVRDLRLGRPVTDVDVVVAGDPAPAARRLARRPAGRRLPSRRRHGAWRVVLDGRTVDFTGRRGGDIVADLGRARLHRERDGDAGRRRCRRRRDRPVRRPRATWPRAGCAWSLTTSSPTIRSACCAWPGSPTSSGSRSTPAAERLARRDAHLADRAAGERIYAEVRRLLAPDHPDAAVRLLDGLGVLDVILPEAIPMRGCEQSPFHHLDVFEHTLQVLDAAADIAAHPEHYLPRHADAIRGALDETVGDELDARTALRLAVLFHDIEKPSTRTVSDDGRIGFMGHDRKGAETTGRILKRWRAATSTIRFCALLVAEHLRLGFMVHDRPLDRRDGYRYLRATEPHTHAERGGVARRPVRHARRARPAVVRTRPHRDGRRAARGGRRARTRGPRLRCFAAMRSPSWRARPGRGSASWSTRWPRSRRPGP